MSTTESPNLILPYIQAAQAQKHVTHNDGVRALDALVQMAILDRDLAAPPGSPADGARYIVATGPTGVWAGHAGHIAAFQDGAWAFYVPREGWVSWVADEDILVAYNGTAWVSAGGGSVNPTPLVGVNATADATNRLSVSSPAILFNHAGAGMQAKLNKNAAADTASFLFQTGFSGRAEMGTTGDDDFHFKVSPDGTVWTEALLINKTTGLVTLTNKSVANAALADIPTATFKGRTAAGTGVPQDLTATQATALLNAVVGDAGSGGTKGLAPAPAAGDAAAGKFLHANGTWALPAGGGEANTASNVNAGGVGVFKQKTGVNLEFRGLNAGSAKVTVTNDTANNEIDIDVAEANLTLGNLGGSIDLSGAKASGILAASRFPALTGDVTTTAGALATTIAAGAVNNAKQANMAANTLKGNNTGAAAAPADLTAAQAKTLLAIAAADVSGLGALATQATVNLSTQATGTLAAAQEPAHTGDVTNTAGSLALTIATNAVTNAKAAQMAANTIKGNNAGATANAADLTAAQATAILNAVVGDSGSGGTKGMVPAPAAGDAAAGRFLKADGSWATPPGGGSGSPGGATTQVQFNDAGVFGGAAGIVYDKTTQKVTLTSQDTLFNHNGASKQIQVNKNAAGNSASILFQDAFSGRAEFGLLGDDDFHLKVSADGSAFTEAWIINRTSAEVSVRKALALEDQAAIPATPTTGMKLWSRSLAGRRHLFATDPVGDSYPLQPHIARTRIGRWNPIGNATTAPLAEGIAVPTATGTATARNVATTNMLTAMRRLGYVSASTAGSLAGPRLAAAQFWRGNAAGLGGFTLYCRFATSDAATVAGARMFVGLSSTVSGPTNVEPNTVNNTVGVGQLAASNNLQIITRDAGTAQTIDLGASFPANTLSVDVYELLLFCAPNGSSIGYRVERLNTGDVAEGTLSANLPVNTTLMGIQLWRSNNAAALAVGLDLIHLQIETDG
jgi:hypothetical protein